MSNWNPIITEGVPEVSPQEVFDNADGLLLIDVRRPEEFTGELGHVNGAELITLGPDLQDFLERCDKDSEIVFICRSGGRSANATLYAQQQGFTDVFNMNGGMIRWNKESLPVEK
jgi:rhodanese-related sulfurtransferase